MSLLFRASLLLLGAVAPAACDREERQSRGQPLPETAQAGATQVTIYPGGSNAALVRTDPRAAAYERNAFHISQGQQLYGQMNCVGCHAHGGGGMGPALIDDEWRYGGSMEQIVSTIAEGRPNGMPAWRGKLTENQMWELAAYVRSLSGQEPKDAVSARGDEVSNTPPQTQTRREEIGTSESTLQ